jgi:hypothetical protein
MRKNLQRNCIVTILLFLLVAISGNSQVVTTNRNPVGMEHNMLFNAVTRYKVTQTGDAPVDLNMLFDGALYPSYSTVAVNPSNPTVITIEGLPSYNTQAGAWVGWSTRYWQPRRFKIEAYNTWNGNTAGWITVADYSNTDFNSYDFKTQLPDMTPISLRFTFYQGSGAEGRLGLSELFYLQPEGMRPYDGLLKYDDGTTGVMNVGGNNSNVNGYGSKLTFLGASDNTDPLWIARYNNGSDNSELRVNITDNPGQAEDKFAVGVTTNDNVWHPVLTVRNDHNIIADGKITATEVQVKQDVWSDFVFKPAYKLKSLNEVEQFIQTHGHLPEIPSETEVKQNGLNMGDMQSKLLQKVEELTLYVIQQQKTINQLKQESKK